MIHVSFEDGRVALKKNSDGIWNSRRRKNILWYMLKNGKKNDYETVKSYKKLYLYINSETILSIKIFPLSDEPCMTYLR